MRLASEISRCKCPRCVAARRMRFVALIAVCIIIACGAYLAFDPSYPMPLESAGLALAPKTLPHSTPSSTAIGAQPSQLPVTGQQAEVIAQSVPESAVSPAPAGASSSTSRDPKSLPSSATDTPRGLRVEAAAIWAPVVTGISPDRAGNLAAEALSKSEESATRLAVPSKQDAADSSESKESMAAAKQTPVPTNLTTSENPGNVPSSGLRVEAAAIWAPVVTAISPDRAGNQAPEALSKSEVSATRLAAPSKQDAANSSESKQSIAAAKQTPVPTNLTTSGNPGNVPSVETQHAPQTFYSIAESPSIVMLQPNDLPLPEPSVAKPPLPSANSEPSTRENARPMQNADHGEVAVTPSLKSNELSVIPPVATAEPDRLPRSQRQAGLVGKISLTQPQGKVRKAREIALDRSSANLYVSRPTPPPSPSPVEQKTESVASAPPPPVDAPSKSSNRDRSGETDVGGDLRRFAASYVREQEKEDVASQERYYSGSVHFYGEGDLSWTRIAAATRRYHRDSGQRRYNVLPANVRGPVDGGFWVVDQPYTWSKSDGTRVQTGKSVLRMRVIPSGRGRFKITSVEQVGG